MTNTDLQLFYKPNNSGGSPNDNKISWLKDRICQLKWECRSSRLYSNSFEDKFYRCSVTSAFPGLKRWEFVYGVQLHLSKSLLPYPFYNN